MRAVCSASFGVLLLPQVMATKEVGEAVGGLKKLVPTGTCVLIEGLLAETPEGTKQVCLLAIDVAVAHHASSYATVAHYSEAVVAQDGGSRVRSVLSGFC
jgi:hypothetical protein